ncbi:hypothetical protein J1614_007024 [Plenodomus biglobosus]|nr:hypothetical protein J1614_007024 [Plenodomus biglobosus]
MAGRLAGAPPIAPPTNRRIAKWQNLKIHELVDLENLKQAHRYYDPSSYRTRSRRKAHLNDFEYFC